MPPVPETYAGKVTKTDFINVAVELNAKVSAVSPLTLIAGAATAKPLIIRGAASQTANLQEWQNSSSTPLLSITSSGGIFANNQAGHVFGDSASIGAILNVILKGNYQGIITRAHTSQTANLQEWQDSAGTVLVSVLSDGRVHSRNQFAVIDSTDVARIKLVIRGTASQTADLAQFQNSSGTILFAIEASGRQHITSAITSGAATAGGGATLPATVAGFYKILINGTERHVPYYN